MTGHSEKQYSDSLSHSVWSADWIRRSEASAAASLGISLYQLMQRAGEAAYALACDQYPAATIGWCCVAMVITVVTAMCRSAGSGNWRQG